MLINQHESHSRLTMCVNRKNGAGNDRCNSTIGGMLAQLLSITNNSELHVYTEAVCACLTNRVTVDLIYTVSFLKPQRVRHWPDQLKLDFLSSMFILIKVSS